MTTSLRACDETISKREKPKYSAQEDGTPVFVIGLTMAGAISAGAYTAGVVDYLVRAMQAHNARVGTPGGPHHKVMIKAMSGASAGGMCAGLIATNLMAVGNGGEDPDWDQPTDFTYPGPGGTVKHGSRVLNRIYKAWVSEVKMWNPDTGEGLLGLQDFAHNFVTIDQTPELPDGKNPEKNVAPISVLNGTHLDDVATAALSGIPAWPEDRQKCDFISSELDIFLTTTAINGTYYKVDFQGGAPFVMEQHSIVRHFRINHLGSGLRLSSPWLEDWKDVGINLDPHKEAGTLPLTRMDGNNWSKLTIGSLATGAFPVGLSPRVIHATPQEMGADPTVGEKDYGGALPYDIPAQLTVHPDFGNVGLHAHTPYISVDGGMINNEPFAYTRYAIRQGYTETVGDEKKTFLYPNPQSSKEAHRAVLMVDPFPEGGAFKVTKGKPLIEKLGLLPVGSKLLSTLMGQARFKPAELVKAQDPDVHSRFLISPQRNDGTHHETTGSQAIACGLLSGFGGFLDEKFRQHDFILGQRNCQKFLKDHFTLDPENPVLQLDADERKSVREAWQAAGKTGEPAAPVIDPGEMADADHEIVLHEWPQMQSKDLKAIMKQMEVRLQKLVKAEISELKKKNMFTREMVGLGWDWLCKSSVLTYAKCAVLEDLILRDQLACFHTSYYTPAYRLLLAGLAMCGDTCLKPAELLKKVKEAQNKGQLPKKLQADDPEIVLPTEQGVSKFYDDMKRMHIIENGFWANSHEYRLNTDHILKMAA